MGRSPHRGPGPGPWRGGSSTTGCAPLAPRTATAGGNPPLAPEAAGAAASRSESGREKRKRQ
eukprot:5964708-Alexandrium_andersonii.AAC.1